jgi:hypothetical protein
MLVRVRGEGREFTSSRAEQDLKEGKRGEERSSFASPHVGRVEETKASVFEHSVRSRVAQDVLSLRILCGCLPCLVIDDQSKPNP